MGCKRLGVPSTLHDFFIFMAGAGAFGGQKKCMVEKALALQSHPRYLDLGID